MSKISAYKRQYNQLKKKKSLAECNRIKNE